LENAVKANCSRQLVFYKQWHRLWWYSYMRMTMSHTNSITWKTVSAPVSVFFHYVEYKSSPLQLL
jgi:hypothetical protein